MAPDSEDPKTLNQQVGGASKLENPIGERLKKTPCLTLGSIWKIYSPLDSK